MTDALQIIIGTVVLSIPLWFSNICLSLALGKTSRFPIVLAALGSLGFLFAFFLNFLGVVEAVSEFALPDNFPLYQGTLFPFLILVVCCIQFYLPPFPKVKFLQKFPWLALAQLITFCSQLFTMQFVWVIRHNGTSTLNSWLLPSVIMLLDVIVCIFLSVFWQQRTRLNNLLTRVSLYPSLHDTTKS